MQLSRDGAFYAGRRHQSRALGELAAAHLPSGLERDGWKPRTEEERKAIEKGEVTP